MNDLEQRVKVLEAKVKILEETLETLKNIGTSEQMDAVIKQKKRTLKMVGLVNTVSDKPELDFSREEKCVTALSQAKRTVDAQIASALSHAGTFSEDFPNDPRYFTYEVETTSAYKKWNYERGAVEVVREGGSRGIRITGYNGFESERVVVPKEIDGVSVTSIGEKAFMNASFHELILPQTIQSIGSKAFSGCNNLKHIDLPTGLTHVGEYCFEYSGLVEIALPDALSNIPGGCFYWCENLTQVKFGENTKTINGYAFSLCRQLKNLSLPETVTEIKSSSLSGTSISQLIIPANANEVSYDILSSYAHTALVFLGMTTKCVGGGLHGFEGVDLIYCLPGSAIQKFAREHKIPIKPLSEFRLEDCQ